MIMLIEYATVSIQFQVLILEKAHPIVFFLRKIGSNRMV